LHQIPSTPIMQGGDYMLETLKSSLLFSFHTGNVVVDTFVTGFIICVSTYLVSLVSKFQDVDFRGWLNCIFGESHTFNEITISGKKTEGAHSTRLQYSDTFHAILYQIKKLDCASSNIFKLSEIQLDEHNDYDDWSDNDSDIDVKLKFVRCTNQCLAQMYEHFFNDTEKSLLWPGKFDKSSLPDDRWTPAEVTQILLNNIHDPHRGLTQLVTEYPQTNQKEESQNQGS